MHIFNRSTRKASEYSNRINAKWALLTIIVIRHSESNMHTVAHVYSLMHSGRGPQIWGSGEIIVLNYRFYFKVVSNRNLCYKNKSIRRMVSMSKRQECCSDTFLWIHKDNVCRDGYRLVLVSYDAFCPWPFMEILRKDPALSWVIKYGVEIADALYWHRTLTYSWYIQQMFDSLTCLFLKLVNL